MILNDLFENKLMELRRNPTVNSKQAFTDDLQKYAHRQDIFVSFTSDVGKKSHNNPTDSSFLTYNEYKTSVGGSSNVSGHKIGINPKTEYNTPIGIYAYPVDYVLDKGRKVPFAGDEPYIQVLQYVKRDRILDLKSYTRANLEEDMANCEEILKDFLEDNQSKITEIRSKLENQKHYGYVAFLDELNEITNPEKTVWKGHS